MATSRVGGSKGKLTGQVGDVIYQMRKNSDGTYTQIMYNKGQRTETVLTPRLQAQRMCAAMVENAMKQLRPIATISMQSARNKTTSLNAWASFNLRKVQRDCQEHWYGQNLFIFPARNPKEKDIQDLGGPYLISSGSLRKDVFDRKVYDEFPAQRWQGSGMVTKQFYGVLFNCNLGTQTLNDFRMKHSMTSRDSICFAGFRNWFEWNEGEEESVEYMKHSYFVATMNMRMPSSTILDESTIPQYFSIASDVPVSILFAKDRRSFAIGILTDFEAKDESFYYDAAFSISYASGKKLISSSTYTNPDGGQEPWWLNREPANVFGSWMGEPSVRPYPSPF